MPALSQQCSSLTRKLGQQWRFNATSSAHQAVTVQSENVIKLKCLQMPHTKR